MNELAELKDIHLPPGVSMWPLAIGWYVVTITILMLLAFSMYRLIKWFQYNKPKKQALKLLGQLKTSPDTQNKLTQIALLLKRVAIRYHGIDKVAKLSGNRWIDFLNKTSKTPPIFTAQTTELLLKTLYQNRPQINANQMHLLIQQSEKWIKQR